MPSEREFKRKRRHYFIRSALSGTAERPRLCVHKSLKHIYAQVIDDESGRSLVQVTSNSKEVKGGNNHKNFCNIETAKKIGQLVGERAKAAGVERVVFDRGGFLYHGCVKALAEAAREAGLKF